MEVWSAGLVQVPEPDVEIVDWWKNSLLHLPNCEGRVAAALLVYMAWNIWKERNGRIFDGVLLLASPVVVFIKKETGSRQAALRVPSVL